MKEHQQFCELARTGTGRGETGDRAEQEHLHYECGGCCRLCPFPGLKCIRDSHDLESRTWKY